MVMKTDVKSRPANEPKATELIDTLIAISVVAKRLAENLRQSEVKEENPSEKNRSNESL